ncbi:hypothetical protein BH09MYX1_BH09MYX1_09630 [soil metagenome]
MRREAWGQLFRGMVASAAAGLTACGGQVAEPADAARDTVDVDAADDARDGDIFPDLDATSDVTLTPINVAECQTEKGSFCSAYSVYDLACVRKKLGLPESSSLSAADISRLVTDEQPCFVDLEKGKLFCGQLCPGGPGRPGLVVLEGVPHDMRTLAGFFAECAVREAASVYGFEQVVRELVVHGAPEHLVEWARRAAQEEVRHAAEMRAEARARGIEPRKVSDANPPTDSLLAFARANLAEGCVAETYSALQLVWMAQHAAPGYRELLARTAEDEVGHAGLAFEIHEWAASRLAADERTELRAALQVALRDMVRDASVPPPDALAEIGMPSADVAQAIALQLAGHLMDHPSLG